MFDFYFDWSDFLVYIVHGGGTASVVVRIIALLLSLIFIFFACHGYKYYKLILSVATGIIVFALSMIVCALKFELSKALSIIISLAIAIFIAWLLYCYLEKIIGVIFFILFGAIFTLLNLIFCGEFLKMGETPSMVVSVIIAVIFAAVLACLGVKFTKPIIIIATAISMGMEAGIFISLVFGAPDNLDTIAGIIVSALGIFNQIRLYEFLYETGSGSTFDAGEAYAKLRSLSEGESASKEYSNESAGKTSNVYYSTDSVTAWVRKTYDKYFQFKSRVKIQFREIIRKNKRTILMVVLGILGCIAIIVIVSKFGSSKSDDYPDEEDFYERYETDDRVLDDSIDLIVQKEKEHFNMPDADPSQASEVKEKLLSYYNNTVMPADNYTVVADVDSDSLPEMISLKYDIMTIIDVVDGNVVTVDFPKNSGVNMIYENGKAMFIYSIFFNTDKVWKTAYCKAYFDGDKINETEISSDEYMSYLNRCVSLNRDGNPEFRNVMKYEDFYNSGEEIMSLCKYASQNNEKIISTRFIEDSQGTSLYANLGPLEPDYDYMDWGKIDSYCRVVNVEKDMIDSFDKINMVNSQDTSGTLDSKDLLFNYGDGVHQNDDGNIYYLCVGGESGCFEYQYGVNGGKRCLIDVVDVPGPQDDNMEPGLWE